MRLKLLIFLFLFFPSTALSACGEVGVTLVYVNGILTDRQKAENDLNILERNFKIAYPEIKVRFLNGYNPSHLAGVGDVVQAVAQAYGSSINDFDLKTILRQIHPQVQTRRLLLVGHSQGNFYTNAMYDYLLAHGEPKEAVGVYAVATPASRVAGGGAHLNNSNDKLLQLVVGLAAQWGVAPPLPFNATLPRSAEEDLGPQGGHSFSDAYLAQAPQKIVADISEEVSSLKPAFAGAGECFSAPEQGLGYRAQTGFFAVADPAAAVAKAGVLALDGAGRALGETALAAVAAAWSAVAGLQQAQVDAVAHAAEALTDQEHTEKNFSIVKTVYGSSLSKEDIEDLLGPNPAQGGAVALAFETLSPEAPVRTEPVEPQPEPATAPEPVIPQETGAWVPKSSGGGGGQPVPEPPQAAATSPATTTASSTPADTDAPVFGTVQNIAATSSSGSAVVVSYPVPSVQDVVDGSLPVSCTPASGSVFALGTTAVVCDARDAAGNAASTTFAVTVSAPPFAPALPDTGFYCDGDNVLKVPSDTAVEYRPTADRCTFLAGFSTNSSWTVGGGVFKGVVGSSTYEAQIPFAAGQKQFSGSGYVPQGVGAGVEYFVAYWQYYNSVGAQYNAWYVPDMVSYLKTGVQQDGTVAGPPSLEYRVMPFRYSAVQ